MGEIFFFDKLIAAGCCLPVLFLQRRSSILLLKKSKSKLWAAWLGAAFGFLVRAAQALGVAVALPLLGKLRGICSNRKIWNWNSIRIVLRKRSANLGIPLLIIFSLLLGTASTTQAAGLCAPISAESLTVTNPPTIIAFDPPPHSGLTWTAR